MIDGIEGVEDSEWILEDGLHLAAEGQPLFALQLINILAFIQNLPGGGGSKAQQQHGHCRLATATLAGNRDNGRFFLR